MTPKATADDRKPRSGPRRTLVAVAAAALLASSSARAVAEPSDQAGTAHADSPAASPCTLTADDVARAAQSTSFGVEARTADLEVAEAEAVQAWMSYLPRLSTAGSYTRLSPVEAPSFGSSADGTPIRFPVFLNQTLLQGALSVPLSDYLLRIPQTHASARNAENAARFTMGATRLQVALDARLAFYEWVRARLQVVVARQALDQANAHLRDAAARASPADIARAQSRVAGAELVVERARTVAFVAEHRTRTIMHDASGRAYAVGENVEIALPRFESARLDELWREAAATRLEVKALAESAEAQRLQAQAWRAAAWPRLDAVGNVLYANPNSRIFPSQDAFHATWDLGVRVTWSPNDTATGLQASRGAEARASAFEAQRSAMMEALRSEVTEAYSLVLEADVAVSTTERGLEAAEESYRVRQELFRAGRATSAELIDADTDLTRARVDALGAKIDQRVARARLAHAVGRDVRVGGVPRSAGRQRPAST